MLKIFTHFILIFTCFITFHINLFAQDSDNNLYLEALQLEEKFQKLAEVSIPKTVLIKAILRGLDTYMGAGSGALISQDGYILTCAHVVESASKIIAVLSDGTHKRAKVIGIISKKDIAIIKIEGNNLPYFDFGDPDKLQIGDWVMALGHPGGPSRDLKPAFSIGRVTGRGQLLKAQMGTRIYYNAIQTDVPIYTGNSGGPLINLYGMLVGINAAIRVDDENAYAIPINQFQENINVLKNGILRSLIEQIPWSTFESSVIKELQIR